MKSESSHTTVAPRPAAGPPTPLRLPPDAASASDSETQVAALRAFFHGGAAEELDRPDADWLPAALHPYRNPSSVRNEYPLFLHATGVSEGEARCEPLSSLLQRLLIELAPEEDDARILKDNIARLEQGFRVALGDDALPRPIDEVFPVAAGAMRTGLALHAGPAEQLNKDLERLGAGLPPGTLLNLSETSALHLFVYAADCRVRRVRAVLRHSCMEAIRHLRDVLRGEHAREERDRVEGTAQAFFDPAELAKVLKPSRGAPQPDTERCTRINALIATLAAFLDAPDAPSLSVVYTGELPAEVQTSVAAWHATAPADLCATLTRVFDEMAGRHATLLAALRVARLELEGRYDPARHAAAAAALSWESFSREELLALPVVLAWTPAAELIQSDLTRLSSMLLCGRPVQFLLTVQPHLDPSDAEGAGATSRYRFEPAYLGISHREVLVHQTSAARPEHLLEGCRMSLAATRAGLHVIASGLTVAGAVPQTGSWLQAGAALEGRAHPFLHYNPEAGATWMRRFDISGNPSVDDDWPRTTLTCQTADGQRRDLDVSFTFADFALLEETHRDHFRVATAAQSADHLIPLAEYLERPVEEMHDELPMIWAADAEGQLHRVVVSQALAHLCRDRLNYWRTMQELAGVRNEHVREALAEERARLENEFAAERLVMQEEHEAVVERVRDTTAREALQRLAAALLNADPAALASGTQAEAAGPVARIDLPDAPTEAAPLPPSQATTPAPSTPADEEAEDSAEEQEPWITSALCTSCNDCTDLNPRLFVYNANKQAVIGDPSAGTFAELVQAAEKCPARCIHPGQPLDPGEATPELLARARPFNGDVAGA